MNIATLLEQMEALLSLLLNARESSAKAHIRGLKMENPVKRTAKQGEKQNKKAKRNLKCTFLGTGEQMKGGTCADDCEKYLQPIKVLEMKDRSNKQNELRKNQQCNQNSACKENTDLSTSTVLQAYFLLS